MLVIDDIKIQSLLKKILDNDESAFEEFFFYYQPMIYRFLYRFTGIKEAAEDLTQETFIKFWEAKENLDLNSAPTAYLFRIARNLANNYVTRKPPFQPIYDKENLLVNICRDPEKEYDQIFLLDDFQNAINSLPEKCRAIFILSRYNSYEYSQIAETFNISLQTVKNQMNKAISILRKRLAFHLD